MILSLNFMVQQRNIRTAIVLKNFLISVMVAWAMAPVLRKIYKKDEEYKEALNNHFNYFNSTTVMSSMILGATLAIIDKMYSIRGEHFWKVDFLKTFFSWSYLL